MKTLYFSGKQEATFRASSPRIIHKGMMRDAPRGKRITHHLYHAHHAHHAHHRRASLWGNPP